MSTGRIPNEHRRDTECFPEVFRFRARLRIRFLNSTGWQPIVTPVSLRQPHPFRSAGRRPERASRQRHPFFRQLLRFCGGWQRCRRTKASRTRPVHRTGTCGLRRQERPGVSPPESPAPETRDSPARVSARRRRCKRPTDDNTTARSPSCWPASLRPLLRCDAQ